MSGELRAIAATGKTLYAIVLNGTYALDTNLGYFDLFGNGAWGDYAIPLTEIGSWGVYTGDLPYTGSVGRWWFLIYDQAGGTPANGDALVAEYMQDVGENNIVGAIQVLSAVNDISIPSVVDAKLIGFGVGNNNYWPRGNKLSISGNDITVNWSQSLNDDDGTGYVGWMVWFQGTISGYPTINFSWQTVVTAVSEGVITVAEMPARDLTYVSFTVYLFPPGFAGGGGATAEDVAAAILETPANLLVTDSEGAVVASSANVTMWKGEDAGSAPLKPSFAGRTVGVDADGAITTVTSVTNGVTLADDAITAAKFDESTAFPLKAADSGSTYVARTGADGDTLETLSDQLDGVQSNTAAILQDTGTTLPALFAADGAAVTVISAVEGDTITLRVGDTWEFTVTDATLSLSDYETIGLVVKRSDRQTDNEALLYLRSDTGLARIGGAAPVSAGNGTLSKTATSFTGTVALAETSASGLRPGSYTWWLKCFDTTPNPDEAFTLVTGAFVLERAGLAAVA